MSTDLYSVRARQEEQFLTSFPPPFPPEETSMAKKPRYVKTLVPVKKDKVAIYAGTKVATALGAITIDV